MARTVVGRRRPIRRPASDGRQDPHRRVGRVRLAGGRRGRTGRSAGEWLGIYAMAVAPEARRRGLARRVLRALMAWGRERGCTRAYLVVVERNEAARALYESEGFEPAGGYHYRVRPVRP
ncbi:N-acetyltransferase [Actinomadura sp. J1-007]|uniref:GNAT family N-acetyltransferase n=1 Tax=Actinomadura sp. J1-007 TaxID=2661913 RepID=UPI001F4FD516|nr:GNAT family N-acetyltransferase [Actinomadura sp. J1-007]